MPAKATEGGAGSRKAVLATLRRNEYWLLPFNPEENSPKYGMPDILNVDKDSWIKKKDTLHNRCRLSKYREFFRKLSARLFTKKILLF